MNLSRAVTRSAAILALATALPIAAPAHAAQADLDLLQSYIGSWRGTGTMQNGSNPSESIRCQMNITRSSDEKVNFDGRCALAGAALSIRGTLAYINNRYEAVMSSNTSFQGTAIGRRNGQSVTFNLSQVLESGETANIEAGFALQGENINVDFRVNNDEGGMIVADVPFAKQ